MGNGPSLLQSLDANKDILSACDLIVVNDMGLSPEYEKYKPGIYVLCDPAYWLDHISSEETEKYYICMNNLFGKQIGLSNCICHTLQGRKKKSG
jgi:hypothetical protein